MRERDMERDAGAACALLGWREEGKITFEAPLPRRPGARWIGKTWAAMADTIKRGCRGGASSISCCRFVGTAACKGRILETVRRPGILL